LRLHDAADADSRGKGWSVSKLKKSVLDVRVGKFVILGRAKKNTQRQEKVSESGEEL
jgi:hypothetical protein